MRKLRWFNVLFIAVTALSLLTACSAPAPTPAAEQPAAAAPTAAPAADQEAAPAEAAAPTEAPAAAGARSQR